MDAQTMLALNGVIGFVSSNFVIPMIQQPRWSGKTRSLVTFGYCLVVGTVVSAVAGGGFSVAGSVAGFIAVWVTAIATYKGFANDENVGIATRIEHVTSPPSLR